MAMAMLCMAHVGSPDTFFNGEAGPYPVRISVRLPGVIPGLAQINVRVVGESPESITSVTAQAIQWNLGPEGAPPPDVAPPVAGDRELFATDLWFMSATSYRVQVVIDGKRGRGTAIVPVMALATDARPMPRGLGGVLAVLGLFLTVGLLTIIGVAVRESGVPPGESPTPQRRRRAWIAMAIGAVIVVLAVVGGRAWWDAEAYDYGEFVLYRPFKVSPTVQQNGAQRVLTLAIDDRRWPPPPGNIATRYNRLMPDHGKLMHMFVIRDPAADVFAHLHPTPRQPNSQAFDVVLPPLPAGRYRVYGDITHESGYAQTLVATVDLTSSGGASVPSVEGTAQAAPLLDADDSWFTGNAVAESASPVFQQSDGGTVTWKRGAEPIEARKEQLLTFTVRDGMGVAQPLEPYMGMLGHVAVARMDGSVFAHLHPSGSISMAALQKFSEHAGHGAVPTASEFSTLFAFPKSGPYRIWVQTKQNGQVQTAAFDVEVR